MQQTTLSHFFTGVKRNPTPRIEKCKKVSQEKKLQFPVPVVMKKTPSKYDLQCEKRHLVAPIISDDEENGECTITVNKPKPHSYSPVKKKSTIDFQPSLPSPGPSTSKRSSTAAVDDSDSDRTIIISPRKHTPKSVKRKLIVEIESSSSENEQEVTVCSQINQTINLISPEKTKTDNDLNLTTLNVIRKFICAALQSEHLKCLLCNEDKRLFSNFLSMDTTHQYTCMKLFMYKRSWYNIFKYCERIGVKMSQDEIIEMYKCLEDNKFTLTSFKGGDLGMLLHYLDRNDVKEIYQSFKLKKGQNKDVMIGKLLKLCSTQSTLTSFKSTEQVLRERIQQKMGYSIKLSDAFYDSIFRVYLLNTFTNKHFTNPKDYFASLGQKIEFPKYNVEEYRIFHTQEEFLKYVEAMRCYIEFEKAFEAKNMDDMSKICNLAFDMLQKLSGDRAKERSRLPHLKRFTASAQYASILTMAAKHLTTSYFNDVVVWLNYLLEQNLNTHKRSVWYCRLALIQTTYLKDYESAAKTVIKALEEENFSEIQLHDLAERGKILHRKNYKLSQVYLETIASLSPPSCDKDWPSVFIERHAMRTNISGQKRKYIQVLPNGERIFLSVEATALDYYKDHGYPQGDHFEGSFITATFSLLFWDIIYDAYIEGTFVSEIQSYPLDMFTNQFYLNRQKAISKRLEQIRTSWSDDAFETFLIDKYLEHSHVMGLIKVDGVVDSSWKMLSIIRCIKRNILSYILERLVKNYREFHGGFPDLLLWNVDTNKAKFVEVKGENDKLSIKQKLWLSFLLEIGADAEVCHIHSIGSKRKRKLEHISNGE